MMSLLSSGRLATVLALGIILVALAGCSQGPPAEAVYRLELRFEVDGRPLTGSVVQAIRVRNAGGTGNPLPRTSFSLAGEALVMSLPGRPTLIALMMTGNQQGYRHILPEACDFSSDDGVNAFIGQIRSFTGHCELGERQLPQLLIIRDPSDPFTLETIGYDELARKLPGVRFLGAGLSSTDEPVTSGIEAIFPRLVIPPGTGPNPDYVLNKIDIGIRLVRPVFISRFPS